VSHAPKARGLTVFLDAVNQFGEKESNLHYSWFRARRHTIRRPPSRYFSDSRFRFRFGGKESNLHDHFQRVVAYPLADLRECPVGIAPT
jgi:hypothetical protein